MKAIRGMLAVIMLLAFVVTIVALARGAPPGNDQVSVQQVAVVTPPQAAPTVTLSTAIYQIEPVSRVTHYAEPLSADTSDLTGLSTTGDERNRKQPETVLLA